MFCSSCGTQLPNDAICCYKCANPVTANFTSSASAVRQVESTPKAEKPNTVVVRNNSGMGAAFLMLVVLGGLGVGGFYIFNEYQNKNGIKIDEDGISINYKYPKSQKSSVPTNSSWKAPKQEKIDVNIEPPAGNGLFNCTIFTQGNTVNLKRNCDTSDCDTDGSTVAGKIPNGTEVVKESQEIQSIYGYTWVPIIFDGERYFVASKKLACEQGE